MLKIEGLHVRVDGKAILKGVDLELPAGEVAAIMGPNGSGKSTLSYVLAGREGYEVTGGRVLYDGQDLLAMEPEERAAAGARNYTQCDSLLIGGECGAHTIPYVEVKNRTARVEHEATTSKISDDQLFYCMQRGLSAEDAVSMIVSGFCKQVFKELPMEFAVEAQKLLGVSLEGSIG